MAASWAGACNAWARTWPVPGSTASNVNATASFARTVFMVMGSQSRENRKKTRLAATC